MDSPWKILDNWLFDNNINSDIPKELNIHMFSYKWLFERFLRKLDVVHFLNKYYEFGLLSLTDKTIVLKALKEIIILKNIKPNNLLFPKFKKSKELINDELRKLYPGLNDLELKIIENKLEDDKKIKISKTKTYDKIVEEIKQTTNNSITTFQEWKSLFDK